MRSFVLIFALLGSLLWLAGCGSSSGSTPSGVANITVSLTPSSAQTVKAGGTLNIVASANDPNGAGVSWSMTGVGSLTNETTSSATYAAPASVTNNQTVTVTAASITNPAATASLQITVTPSTAVSVTISPSELESLTEGQTLSNIKATVNNSTNQSITWSLSGAGTLTPSNTANPVTYNAPSTVTTAFTATLTATSAATGKPTASLPISVYAPDTTASGVSAQNVATVLVDGGGQTLESETGVIYPDGGFVTVTVCAPGTLNCNTIDHVLLDTGSYGLRVLTAAAQGELSISLPQESIGGSALSNCIAFVDGSYLWGNVVRADIQVGGEIARSIPIQAIQDPTNFAIPGTCSSNGGGTDEDTLDGLLANGILGIGPEPIDCDQCETTPLYAYQTCPGGACTEVTVPAAQQVTNPVVLFPNDNNGTVYELPSLAGSGGEEASATGSLVFGIGTESNNALGSATVYTMNSSDNFTTDFESQTLGASFIDSGSNGYFFPSSYNVCPDFTSFYCDSQSPSATNIGANGAQGAVNFTIENADTLFAGRDAAFSVLGGPNGTYPCSGSSCSFDWGLSFFFGRNVFTSIDGQTVTGEPAPPWWAY